jgi:hypothetical protein
MVDALNKPNPIPVAEAVRLIEGAFPEGYGPTPKAIDMTIRRLRRKNI